jgi:uncharacterized RDD family membrane protein YckC
MTTLDEYIDGVLAWVPGNHRENIELDLRATLTERVQRGETLDQALSQFGPPRMLAEAYLSRTELRPVGFFRRIVAALIDIPMVVASGFLMFYFSWQLIGRSDQSFVAAIMVGNPIAVGLSFAALMVMTPVYYIVAESTFSQTVGKALFGMRVVTEAGGKISVGQAFVRQIPLFFNFYLLDAVVALFTARKQRAFELISKTRVVEAD